MSDRIEVEPGSVKLTGITHVRENRGEDSFEWVGLYVGDTHCGWVADPGHVTYTPARPKPPDNPPLGLRWWIRNDFYDARRPERVSLIVWGGDSWQDARYTIRWGGPDYPWLRPFEDGDTYESVAAEFGEQR